MGHSSLSGNLTLESLPWGQLSVMEKGICPEREACASGKRVTLSKLEVHIPIWPWIVRNPNCHCIQVKVD